MAELLRCPFCGGNNVAQGASADRISVWCFCGARGPDVAFPEHCDPVPPIDECRAAWNRRAMLAATPPAPPPATEALEKLVAISPSSIESLGDGTYRIRCETQPTFRMFRDARAALAKFKEQSHG